MSTALTSITPVVRRPGLQRSSDFLLTGPRSIAFTLSPGVPEHEFIHARSRSWVPAKFGVHVHGIDWV